VFDPGQGRPIRGAIIEGLERDQTVRGELRQEPTDDS
jgi:hypothetical protein